MPTKPLDIPPMRVDHVSIAVPDLEEALGFFRRHFPVVMRTEKRPGYTPDFFWCDFYVGNFVFELIEPRGSGSFVERFLARRGPGLHHWSLEVERLDPYLESLEREGLRIVDRFEAGPEIRTAFLSPRSAFGVLVQFWQVPKPALPERPEIAEFRLRSGETVRMRVDHVSLAVRDIERALGFFSRYFPFRLRREPHLSWDRTFSIASFYVNGYKVELVSPLPGRRSFLDRFLERRGEGFHHVSIDIDRLDPYVAELEAAGVRVVDRAELPGGVKTAFLSPRSAFGVLVQLWQGPEFRS
ncbi:MAG: hypothetical protein KatS3mg076_0841 [Candidatus Binatia bacterium]|nr:MAG: hypothetical protein KatS3mg076_0841 [Candidatus Binatia bacterium]